MRTPLASITRLLMLLALGAGLAACVPMPATVVVVVTATPAADTPNEPTARVPAKATDDGQAAPTKISRPTAEDTPVAEPMQDFDGSAGVMCAGTFGMGVTCLDAAGWHVYAKSNTRALTSDQIKDIVFCAGGRMYVAASAGLVVSDGTSWSKVDTGDWGATSPDALACDSTGGLWAGHYKGVTFFDGRKATTYKAREFSSESDSPKDVAVGSDGRVWVLTSNGVGVYDGKTWKVYEEGAGFDKKYYFDVIAVDGENRPFIGGTNGIFMLDGAKWTLDDTKFLFQTKSLAKDSQGRIWAGTYSDGVSVFNGRSWTNYNRQNSALSSDHVRSLTIDAQGRVWLGTEWGLNIFDGKDWTAYWMHNSTLSDNEIYAVAVSGGGPALPAPVTKTPGSIAGRIISASVPIAGSIVESCVEYLGVMFSGPSPCSDQPLSRSTRTDADGRFTISDLQPGRYTLTFQGPDKKWMVLTGGLGIGSKRYTVKEGQPTNLDDINIARKE